MSHNEIPALSAAARGAIRSAMVSHSGWTDLRKAKGYSLASMSRDDYLAAAAALGLDVPTLIAPHVTGRAPQNRAGSNSSIYVGAKPETVYQGHGSAPSGFGLASVAPAPIHSPARSNEAPAVNARQDIANARAADDFADAPDATTGESQAPEFDMHDIGEIISPLSPAILAKLDGLAQIAVGSDVSISDIYKAARRVHHCATSLKLALETAVAPVLDPRTAHVAAMSKPSLDFVPPSWTRDFVDYLDIGATIAVVGPAGNGKTTGARKLLERAGFTVYEFDCTDATLPQDLIGRTSLRQEHGATVTEWTAGPIARAFADPKGAVLLNEYDALDPRTGMALQSALEAGDGERRVSAPDTGEQIRSAGKCPIVLTLNTIGHGATVEYQGRNALDGANRDRIEIIMTGYENEAQIMVARGYASETAERLASWANRARTRLTELNSREILSNRRLLTAAALIDRRGYSLNEAVQKAFICRAPERERAALAA